MKPSPFPRRAGDPDPASDEARLTEGVPLAAIIPRKLTDDPELVMAHRAKDPLAERFRRLRSKIESIQDESGKSARVILVTSAVPDEGKSTTAANLALAFAEERQRSTVLVDLDLRRPSIGRYLTPPPSLGVHELIEQPIGLEHILVQVKPSGLCLVPAGKPVANPAELLRSVALRELMAELRRRFDWVVVDSPPAVPFVDASIVQPLVDGALLVVRAATTARAMVERAVEALEAGPILGVVLNDVAATPVDRYYYRYDDYDPYRYADDGIRGTTK